MIIESNANPKVKYLRSLYSKKGRREAKRFIVEGVNSVKDIPDNVKVEYIFANPDNEGKALSIAERFSAEVVVLKDELFARVGDTVTPSGLIAVVEYPEYSIKDFSKVLIMDGISDAGNAGTIIRTAAACGFDAVFAFDSVDLYSPKCVRSTMSGLFRIPCFELSYEEFSFTGDVYLLDMHGEDIFSIAPRAPYAVIVGSEAKGASAFFKERANKIVSIPMTNGVESLNAAVSASLAMYLFQYRR
ncbi:MAG: RNA methyltransferase [Clostridia bacterium]|nr:RNA methyltransferase [Clostridia bacterium]